MTGKNSEPSSPKAAICLLNIGSPNSPSVKDVKAYLSKFLMDPQVIDLPFVVRYPLVNWLIVPFRAKMSASLYQSIWTPEGSPLRVHMENLAKKLELTLGNKAIVRIAMQYGKPTLKETLKEFSAQGVTRILFAPMYPQHAKATTESSLRHVVKHLQSEQESHIERSYFLPPFFDHPIFLEAMVTRLKPFLEEKPWDQVMFSFHGLPKQMVKESSPLCYEVPNCCELSVQCRERCYRAQCYETAHQIARRCHLPAERYFISFQSRLGRSEWIRPYTDEVIVEMAKKGVKRILAVCPSFVADCLETLEEIAIRNRETFLEAGGHDLFLVPALNDHPSWVSGLSQILSTHLPHLE